jgi:hypothetical protein
MDITAEYMVSAILIGAGATAVTDVWAIARKRFSGVATPDFGLVGRWVAHMPCGRFRHESIAKSPSMPHERAIGWTAHYVIGIAFAAILLAIFGLEWARHPTIGPALIVGIGTVAAPFLIMQPGMGAGIAASRTPNPSAARMRSLVAHAVFGMGLYVTALSLCLIRG